MQSYLLEHNGVIDSWPYPVSATVRSSDWAQNNPLEFDYLGADYYTLSDCYVERISDQRIYQNEYHYVGNKPFQKMLAKEENLKRQVRAGKALRNPLVSLGLLYCIFAAPSILGEAFLGTGKSLVAQFGAIQTVEGILVYLGGAALYLLALLVRLFMGVGFFFQGFLFTVIGIVLAAVCLLGTYCCFATLMDRRKYVRKGKKAAGEAKSLPSSPEYFQARQGEEDEIILGPLNEELAEQWHRAWFEWVSENVPQERRSQRNEAPTKEGDCSNIQKITNIEE